MARHVNPLFCLRTGRLILRPVSLADWPDLCALKGDPRVFAGMLGGVRDPARVLAELADEICFWGRYGAGMWTLRDALDGHAFQGVAGIMERPDGRGLALRFALWPEARGRGLAREAAGAALRFAHDQAGLPRIIAVAGDDNVGSRSVLGAIGMREVDGFGRDGRRMLVYESRNPVVKRRALACR